jgi:uncharacterized protein (UPF0248 family)
MYRFILLISILLFYITPSYGQATSHINGMADPDIVVDIYKPEKAFKGTTLLPDHHDPRRTRVIEVNMKGEIIWEYLLPRELRRYTNPGFDAELLPNNNILILLPFYGLYEINRKGDIVWSHLDTKISHDADRLPNGNTIYVFGGEDEIDDAQVKEVNPQGEIVWKWFAKDHFYTTPYKDIYHQGWTHTNAVTRLKNGNTLISLRNFNLIAEVDPKGKVVNIIGKGFLQHQHDPEVLPNGNILVANHDFPQEVLEIDPESDSILWRYVLRDRRRTWPVRDADRLPNGNTLITGSAVIIEVTPEGEVVWRLRLRNVTFRSPREAAGLGFYKAQRIASPE